MDEAGEFEGKDLEEALEAAAGRLGVPADELHYEIVEQGRRGVLGLGVRNVRIRIMPPLDEPAAGGAEPPPEAPREVAPRTAQEIERTTQRILDLMGLALRTRASAKGGSVSLEFDGEDRELLFEREGELLSALQFLLNRMARRVWPDAPRILVAGNGRPGATRRDDEIMRRAREAAAEVGRSGRTKSLGPMNSYERRLVHLAVREFAGLSSSSDGQGALKRVRISKVRNTVR